MNKPTKFLNTTEAEFIEYMHNASMGMDQFKAIQARALKQLGPVILRWVKEERKRGTDSKELGQAACSVTVNLLMSVSHTIARKGWEEEISDRMVTDFLRAYEIFKEEFFPGNPNACEHCEEAREIAKKKYDRD